MIFSQKSHLSAPLTLHMDSQGTRFRQRQPPCRVSVVYSGYRDLMSFLQFLAPKPLFWLTSKDSLRFPSESPAFTHNRWHVQPENKQKWNLMWRLDCSGQEQSCQKIAPTSSLTSSCSPSFSSFPCASSSFDLLLWPSPFSGPLFLNYFSPCQSQFCIHSRMWYFWSSFGGLVKFYFPKRDPKVPDVLFN